MSASVVALIAIAMAVGAVEGAALPDGFNSGRTMLRDASAARAVAAAVTAAVRDMVGHGTLDAAVDFDCTFTIDWLPVTCVALMDDDDVGRSHAPPIAQRLLNIPPPTN
jgi:hypothetical protein